MENGASSEGKDPSGFLGEIIGAPVTVKLNSGVVYKGIFAKNLTKNSSKSLCSERGTTICRWLHEYRIRKDRRICQRRAQKELRGCVCERE